ncbi:unnamed protein product [Camellia sinensis]
MTLRIPSISNQLLTRTSYLSKPPNLSLSKKPPKMSSEYYSICIPGSGFSISLPSLELILCIFLIADVFAGVQSRSAIPGPSGLPIIGLVFAFTGSLTLANLAKTFEAVLLMAFSIGFTRFIISSHPAKDILSSSAFADRPVKESAYELLFHRAMGFAPYGEITCFGDFQQKMGIEMVNQVKGLMEKNGVVEIKRVLHFGSLNNVMMSVFGRSYDFNGCDGFEPEGLVSEGYELLGIFNWYDHFPLLGLLDLQGVRKRCRELVSRVNVFVGKIIEEHRFKRAKNGGVVGGGDDDDFVDVLLDLENDNKLSDSDMIAVLWGMKSQYDEKMFDFVFCKTRTVSTKIKFLGEMQNMTKEFKNLLVR